MLMLFQERVAVYRSDKGRLQILLSPLDSLKATCDTKARNHSSRLVWAGLAGLAGQWIILTRATWWEYSWDVVEPITWFVNAGNSVLAYMFFVVYRRDFTCEALSTVTVNSRQAGIYEKVGFDVKQYDKLREEVREIDVLIEKCREDYE